MIRLLVADDHPIVREGLMRVVEANADMQVVAEAVDGNEALAKALSSSADVVLLDISMPGQSFLDVVSRLKEERPHTRVLILTVHPEEHFAVRALRAGAAGYVTKDHTLEQLAEAIRHVHAGRRYITPSLAEKLAAALSIETVRQSHDLLSDREYNVLRLLGSGKTVGAVSSQLALSPKTISTYRTRILKKMNVKTTAELVRYVIEHDLAEHGLTSQ